MHAVVIGCGRVGSFVARDLAEDGWSVSVIDDAGESFNRLPPTFTGERFEGHALDQEVLRAAGIDRADACVVATSGDNTNLVVAQLAIRKFNVGCVVTRILDPVRADIYAGMGLNIVCPTKAAIDQLTTAVRACEVRA